MEVYPLNLILAVSTAAATIFLGFLPTKTVSSAFFTRESGKAIFAWALVGVTSSHKIAHYPFMFAFLCFAAWWQFRRENALNGKMWLSLASGLGISIGVMLILAVTPQANPPSLPQLNESLLLASIYLGGAIIGLAYVCFALIQSTNTNSGVTQATIQRYIGLLSGLTIVRAAVYLTNFFILPGRYESTASNPGTSPSVTVPFTQLHLVYSTKGSFSLVDALALGLAVFVLPALAFQARNQAHFSSRVQPTRPLVALVLLGILTEILARLLVL